MKTHTCSVRIHGIPAEVTAQIAPAEPDVGIIRSYVDDVEIVGISGRAVRRASHAEWLRRKLDYRDVWDSVCEQIMDSYYDLLYEHRVRRR